MQTTKLEFRSPLMALSVPSEGETFRSDIDGWQVAEHVSGEKQWVRGVLCDSYAVSLHYDVPSAEDPGSAYIAGCYLSAAIDRAWMYATGLPMSPRGFDHFLLPIEPARDWESNATSVIPPDDWELLSIGVLKVNTHRSIPWRPLERTMRALAALANTQDEIALLAQLHYQASRTAEPDLHFLHLARAMEVAREVFVGATADDKERALPSFVRGRLSRSLNWTLAMCQQRRQTRHVIDKKVALTVKPEFTAEEERDFLHDTHLLLLYAVSMRSGLPLTIDEDGTAIEAV